MIISISGRMGSGKDTAGTIILDQFIGKDTWHIKKWAGPLRKVAAILLGMDETFLYTEEFKQMILPEQWNNGVIPMTGREFLQKLGTDAIRNGLHENAWVNSLMNQYKRSTFTTTDSYGTITTVYNPIINEGQESCYPYPNWIITDTRFPNELQAVKEREGITICIKRNLQFNSARLHPSETALDKTEFDHIIDNNDTIEELKEKLILILKQHNLL